jgi:hypothetical protein
MKKRRAFARRFVDECHPGVSDEQLMQMDQKELDAEFRQWAATRPDEWKEAIEDLRQELDALEKFQTRELLKQLLRFEDAS